MIARVLMALIRGYQVVSRLTPRRCRYYPTCSAYAVGAIGKHGAIAGMALAIARLLRCHPWTPGGYDPVPERPFRRPE